MKFPCLAKCEVLFQGHKAFKKCSAAQSSSPRRLVPNFLAWLLVLTIPVQIWFCKYVYNNIQIMCLLSCAERGFAQGVFLENVFP